jgi:diguanylate cyclase (GGDEF)-like protein
MHPFTLRFFEPQLEAAFIRQSLPRMRMQGRIALAMGIFVYALFGVLDVWFVPPDLRYSVWGVRLLVMSIALSVLLYTYHPSFHRYNYGPLVLAGATAGSGMLGILWLLPTHAITYYYTGLVLTAFWTYNFVGTRFVYALVADVALLLAYNILFGGVRGLSPEILASHDYVLVSSNLIGGAAGYMAEQFRRTLFLREMELDTERQLHMQRALHDPLTGLPNRDLLDDRIAHAMTLAQREEQSCAGIFIDLDNFKAINDTLGHDVGDRVLCETAIRIRHVLRETDTISRIAGDEFFVVAHGVVTRQDATDLAHKILRHLEQPLLLAKASEPIVLNASLGICFFPYPECTPADIIRRADQAMYTSKRSGKHQASFSE